MTKERIFGFLEVVINKLIYTDIIICPEGSISKDNKYNINGLYFYDGIGSKPEFTDIQDYRKSLLELIGKLIDFYKEV